MIKRPVFAANWKMHHGPTQARVFMGTFLANTPRFADRTIVIFPPAVSLHEVVDTVGGRLELHAGVQSIHWEPKGAFTGELSAPMARDAGAHMVLVGHSERRHLFHETDEDTGKKVVAAMQNDLIPILCVGETLEERERGETESVVLRQLRWGLAGLDPDQAAGVIIAYEPVWAIGTGRNATPEDAAAVHAAIRRALRDIAGERASEVPILYGGSVNAKNVAALLAAPEVDGVLVGGASLDPIAWSAIVRT